MRYRMLLILLLGWFSAVIAREQRVSSYENGAIKVWASAMMTDTNTVNTIEFEYQILGAWKIEVLVETPSLKNEVELISHDFDLELYRNGRLCLYDSTVIDSVRSIWRKMSHEKGGQEADNHLKKLKLGTIKKKLSFRFKRTREGYEYFHLLVRKIPKIDFSCNLFPVQDIPFIIGEDHEIKNVEIGYRQTFEDAKVWLRRAEAYLKDSLREPFCEEFREAFGIHIVPQKPLKTEDSLLSPPPVLPEELIEVYPRVDYEGIKKPFDQYFKNKSQVRNSLYQIYRERFLKLIEEPENRRIIEEYNRRREQRAPGLQKKDGGYRYRLQFNFEVDEIDAYEIEGYRAVEHSVRLNLSGFRLRYCNPTDQAKWTDVIIDQENVIEFTCDYPTIILRFDLTQTANTNRAVPIWFNTRVDGQTVNLGLYFESDTISHREEIIAFTNSDLARMNLTSAQS